MLDVFAIRGRNLPKVLNKIRLETRLRTTVECPKHFQNFRSEKADEHFCRSAIRPSRKTEMATLKEILTRRPLAATIKLVVPAGGARPGPPVGPALGQYHLNLMAFCKDFNARTQKYKPETPMSVILSAYKDGTFEFTVRSPTVAWFLKRAAGVESGSSRPGHSVASSITLKHVYEIAKIKQSDPYNQYIPLESICKSVMGTARSMGIEVVKEL